MKLLKIPLMHRLFRQRRKVICPPKIFSSRQGRQIVVPYKPISALIISSLIVLCTYLLIRSDIFLIHNLKIEWQPGPRPIWLTEDQVLDSMLYLRGRSLLSVEMGEAREILLERFPPIKNVSLEKKYLDTLQVEVEERKAAALVRAQNGDFLADEEGFIFKEGAEGQAPMFSDPQNQVSVGQTIGSERVSFAIELIQNFQKTEFEASSFEIVNFPTIKVVAKDGPEVLFSAEKEVEIQLATLQLVSKNARIEGKTLRKVDLRFDRPVVTY